MSFIKHNSKSPLLISEAQNSELSTYGHDLLDFHDIFDGDELFVSTGTVCSLHSGQVLLLEV